MADPPADDRWPAPSPAPWPVPPDGTVTTGPAPEPASVPAPGADHVATLQPAAVAAPAPFEPSGLRPLHPAQVQVWRVGYGIAAAVAVAVALAADSVVRLADDVDVSWPWGLPGLVLAVVLGTLVWRMPKLAYDRWRYELAVETLELHRGVVVQSHTAIPYFRVQHIDITRSPVERALGLSQLVVRTAAATTDATIPGVAATEAESLRDVILARTGRDDAV